MYSALWDSKYCELKSKIKDSYQETGRAVFSDDQEMEGCRREEWGRKHKRN